MPEAEKKVVDLIPDLYQGRLQLAEGMRNIYQATVDPKVKREDLLNPKFWKHVSRSLPPYTRIEVVTDDGQYWCELLVITSGHNWAAVKELRYHDLGSVDVLHEGTEMDEFTVAWKGPAVKWALVRKADNYLIKKLMETKEEANAFHAQHIRTITR